MLVALIFIYVCPFTPPPIPPVLGDKSRASHIQGKCSTTETFPWPCLFIKLFSLSFIVVMIRVSCVHLIVVLTPLVALLTEIARFVVAPGIPVAILPDQTSYVG